MAPPFYGMPALGDQVGNVVAGRGMMLAMPVRMKVIGTSSGESQLNADNSLH